MRKIFEILLSLMVLFGSALAAEGFDCTTPARIWPLGDSITLGVEADVNYTGDWEVGYRQDLYLSLIQTYNFDFVGTLSNGTAAEPPDFDTFHDGHSGYTAAQQGSPGSDPPGSLLNGPDGSLNSGVSQWIAQTQPDIVLLHIGTNDLNDFGTSADEIANAVAGVGQVLDAIHAYNPNIIIILAEIINTSPLDTGWTQFNEALAAMAASRTDSANIKLVDMESALDYVDDMSDDGLHPNNLGYSKMAAVWAPAVESVLPVCAPSGPVLVSPQNGQLINGTSATFGWQTSTGPNGNATQYALYLAPGGNFNGVTPVTIQASINKTSYFAGRGGAGIVFLLFSTAAFIKVPRARKKILVFTVSCLVVMGLAHCGGGGGSTSTQTSPTSPAFTYTAGNLSANTTYSWQVVATDAMGKVGTSETWLFSTGQ